MIISRTELPKHSKTENIGIFDFRQKVLIMIIFSDTKTVWAVIYMFLFDLTTVPTAGSDLNRFLHVKSVF